MPKYILDLRASQVIQGIRVRQMRLKAMANAAANAIAQTTNADLIDAVYPGIIRNTLEARAESPRLGGQLVAVRLYVTQPLWYIYEYGARPHTIEATNVHALHFQWERAGGDAYFQHVNHPGFEGRHRLPALEAAIVEESRAQWYAALYDAIIAQGG